MLEINRIKADKTAILQGLKRRGNYAGGEAALDRILALDQERRDLLTHKESMQHEAKKISDSIGALYKQGKREEAEGAKEKSSELKNAIKEAEAKVREVEAARLEELLNVPNVPHESVPAGKGEDDNQEVFRNTLTHKLPGNAKAHWDLATELDIIDWELGAKVTGSGFPVFKGEGAQLVRGLITFFLREAEAAGYREVLPPLLVNEASGYGTGQLPDKEGQMYHVTADNLYLIPTAEVPITNLYRDVILDEADFPVKLCGYTPCFRREAGAYGKDVKGLNRLHQFDKVEIVQLAHPDRSYEILDEMVEHVKGLLEKLGLQYRILLLCGGDTSFASAKTFDFEVFSAGQEMWLEVSSVSNFETFQANRLKLRFRETEKNTKQLAHTLNGSALALPRIIAALLENHQQEDGSILLPPVLQEIMGRERIGA